MQIRSFTGWSTVHPAAIAAAAILAAPAAAHAQYSPVRYPSSSGSRELFEWQGRVDREIQLVVRDGRVVVRRVGSSESQSGSIRVVSALPRQDGYLRVERVGGRGQVDVVAQPGAGNNYTAVVRLADPSRGADYYRVVAYWEPSQRPGDGRRDGAYDRNGHGDGHYGRGGYGRGGVGNGRYGSSGALHWSGDVDGTIQIQLRDQSTTTTNLGGKSVRNVSSTVSGAGLPSYGAQLAVSIREGRGTVQVVQQPSAQNGHTAVIRVSDPAGGYGHYDFDVTWR